MPAATSLVPGLPRGRTQGPTVTHTRERSREGPRLPALDSREIILLFLYSGDLGVTLLRQRRSEASSDPHIPYSPCSDGLRSPSSFSFLAPFPLSPPRPPAVFPSLPPIPSTSQASFPSSQNGHLAGHPRSHDPTALHAEPGLLRPAKAPVHRLHARGRCARKKDENWVPRGGSSKST